MNDTNRKIGITEVVLRDGHQSLLATRFRFEDMESILKQMDNIGYWSVESWGGAVFDSCIRYLGEDPWERIQKIKKLMPRTPQQMLLRGQNLLGYKHYGDDVVDRFVEKAKVNGVDVFRIFDAMNDVRNLEQAIKSTLKHNGHAQGTISYTTSPVHNIERWIELSNKIQDMGADSLAIKDMAGLLTPYVAFELISKLKETIDIPIHLHCHATTGMSTPTIIKAIEAGVDNIDSSISTMSMTYGHTATETVVGMLENTNFDTGLDLDKFVPVANHFKKIREKYSSFEGSLKGVDARIISSQVPGGMLTNLENQLKDQNAIERFDEVIEEIPLVRKDLGYIPLVTPTSQIVGTQAVINVLSNSRYSTITNETESVLRGEYGATPAEVSSELQTKAIGNDEPISCRPADLISNNEFGSIKEQFNEILKSESLQVSNSDENVLTYALFPEVGTTFFKNKGNADFFEKEPLEFIQTESEIYKVSIDGKNYNVEYAKNMDPIIHNSSDSLASINKNVKKEMLGQNGLSINAPLGGNIFKVEFEVGDEVAEDDAVIILEAMKMETAIKPPKSGTICAINVSQGDKVNPGDSLFEIV
ncbi:sodium-extruding oxaloacetate decarboxylase subunit alpha [Gammaproteobacteria bacterium]|nr:sodium-extruding oxaloacetate decarboxylase subunit alpha [Gammaproteobacteria bacterium]MDA9039399.1 sodium-extruding oxaloacetate decarboxylase subunit alpha [Gammaproteobacteria bacterium]